MKIEVELHEGGALCKEGGEGHGEGESGGGGKEEMEMYKDELSRRRRFRRR